MLVALALLVILVAGVRNHGGTEAALLLALLACTLAIGRWLWIDFRAHPAGFPEPSPSHGLRLRDGTTDRPR